MPFQLSTIIRWPVQIMQPLRREPHNHLARIGRNRGCPKQSPTGSSPNPSLRRIFEVPLCQSQNLTRSETNWAIREYPSPAVSDVLDRGAASLTRRAVQTCGNRNALTVFLQALR